MDKDFLYLIDQKKHEFSKGQKKIAEFILKNYDKAVQITASELGKQTGVSESTVVRFATMLGFEGYPELQKEIRKIAKENLIASKRLEVASNYFSREDKSVLKYTMQSDSSRILKSCQNLDDELFNSVVDELLKAERVYIIGSRSSGMLADFFFFHLNLMLDKVINVNFNNNTGIYEHIFRINKNDVCLCFSFPRYSQKTIRAMTYASQKEAVTISVTDNKNAPVSRFSKYLLAVDCDMISVVDSLVAPMSLINAILVALSVKRKDVIKDNYDLLEKLWNEDNTYSNTLSTQTEED